MKLVNVAAVVILLLLLGIVAYLIVAVSVRIWPFSRQSDGFTYSARIINQTCIPYTVKVQSETSLPPCVGKNPGISNIPMTGKISLFKYGTDEVVGTFSIRGGSIDEDIKSDSLTVGTGGGAVTILRRDGKGCKEFMC